MARSKGQEFFHFFFLHLSILIVNLRLDSFASNIIAFIAKHFFRFLRAHQKNFLNPQKKNNKE